MAALEAGRRAERRSRIELPISAVTTWMEQTTPLGSMEGKGHAMKALKGIAMILLRVDFTRRSAAPPVAFITHDRSRSLCQHVRMHRGALRTCDNQRTVESDGAIK
jgi:hypothetical protein